MPTASIAGTATRLVPPNKNRTSLMINNLSGNLAIGLIDNPTLTYNEKSVQITGGQNYAISLGSAIVGYERDGSPIYDNQRWVTGAWWLISSTGAAQTVSYQEIFR
jgi:hypothetical protein